MNLVRIHKEFNRSAVPFYKEKAIDFFTEITKKWNNMYEYEPLIYNATELKNSLNLEKSKNHNYFNEFILQFAKDTTTQFRVGKKIVTGNAFSFSEDTEKNIFIVRLNEDLKEFLFTKADIELMQKSKRKLKMTTTELEKWNQSKEKYKKLMLFSQDELLKFNSKYTKRLYWLIIQFKETGKFIMMYDEFKKIMEIPESYVQGMIDKRIFKKAKEEIETKLEDIKNIQVLKIKSGKSIEKIEITFDCNKSRFEKIKLEETNLFNLQIEIENNGLMTDEESHEQLLKLEELKKRVLKTTKI